MEVFIVEHHAPGVGPFEAANHADDGALAGPVAARDNDPHLGADARR